MLLDRTLYIHFFKEFSWLWMYYITASDHCCLLCPPVLYSDVSLVCHFHYGAPASKSALAWGDGEPHTHAGTGLFVEAHWAFMSGEGSWGSQTQLLCGLQLAGNDSTEAIIRDHAWRAARASGTLLKDPTFSVWPCHSQVSHQVW